MFCSFPAAAGESATIFIALIFLSSSAAVVVMFFLPFRGGSSSPLKIYDGIRGGDKYSLSPKREKIWEILPHYFSVYFAFSEKTAERLGMEN